jgi:hypothetical protein
MTNIIHMPMSLPPLTFGELVHELRAKENALLDLEQDLFSIAKAVWPDGCTEAPQDFAELEQFEVSEVVAGIRSLHELTERLMAENERLRAELKRCVCGAQLARYTGAGASGLLCPVCDAEHAAELERQD